MRSGRRFCYLCGRTTEELYEGLCRGCFQREKKLVNLPPRMRARICKGCGRHYLGRWEDSGANELETLAAKAVRKHLTALCEEVREEVRITGMDEGERSLRLDLEVNAIAIAQGVEQRSTHRSTLELRKVLCPACSKRAGGYYEAVLQLRSENLEEAMREVKTLLDRLYAKDKMAFITGEEKVKGGADLKLGSAKAAKALATYFKSHHHAVTKESATLIGRKKGRNIYRKTMLIRV